MTARHTQPAVKRADALDAKGAGVAKPRQKRGPSPKARPNARGKEKGTVKRAEKPAVSRVLGPVWCAVLVASLPLPLMRLANTPDLDLIAFLPLLAYTVTVLIVAAMLARPSSGGDCAMAGSLLLLCGLGLVIQQRMGAYAPQRLLRPAALAYPMGVLLLIGAWSSLRGGRHQWLQRAWWPALLAACGVLAVVLLLGRRFRGAIFLPGNINPVEIAKPLLILFLAGFLDTHRKTLTRTAAGIPVPSFAFLVTLAMLWGVPMGLLVLQRDLGMLILMNGVLVVMLYAASRKAGYLVLGGVGVMALVIPAVMFFSHGQARLEAWQDPFQDPTGHGWQVLQGLSAMYSGGMWGKGIGAGLPHAVPIVSSDFVYAAIAEELGYVGCALLLAFYGILFSRGFRAADTAQPPSSSLLAVGLTTCLALQTLLNIAGVTKAVPLTGITLPLISHGGSSLITTLLMAGMLLALAEPARHRPRAKRRTP